MMAPKDVKHGGEYQRRLAKYAKTPTISQSIPPLLFFGTLHSDAYYQTLKEVMPILYHHF